MPFFPLGGFTPLQSTALSDVAKRLGATPMQVALAWLLQRAPNILLIPGTSSVAHLRENLAAADLKLPSDELAVLDRIATRIATGLRHWSAHVSTEVLARGNCPWLRWRRAVVQFGPAIGQHAGE